jgi:hypothetical protein
VKSEPWLGTVPSFRKAFPKIKTLELVGRQRTDVMDHYREDRYSADSLPRLIPCANPECQQGGYDVKAYLISLNEGTPRMEGEVQCSGHEGPPRGRRKGDPCWNTLTFSVTATFQVQERGPTP